MARRYAPLEMVGDGLYLRKQVLTFLLRGLQCKLLHYPLFQMPHIILVLNP